MHCRLNFSNSLCKYQSLFRCSGLDDNNIIWFKVEELMEVLAIMKENPTSNASTSVRKLLKLKFRNKITPLVCTGKPLLGENDTTIEIALVDAISEQIENSGPESIGKLEIVGFLVGDNDTNDDSWTFEDFEKIILSEKKGNRILQGNTCLQLKEGVCLVDKIYFTHNLEDTKNGLYRLGAGVVDSALMSIVEVARTEAFLVKDRRVFYSEKYSPPCLSDKVWQLQPIRYKGNSHIKRLEDAGVTSVKDFLHLLHTGPKRLEYVVNMCKSDKT